jgi:hypothetical protein
MLIHAAGESSPGNVKDGTHAGALMVPGEAELLALAQRLEDAGLRPVRIVETDGAHSGQLMAIGLPPGRKAVLRRHLSSLPLLK